MHLVRSLHFSRAKEHFFNSGFASYKASTYAGSAAWNTVRVVTNTALTTAAFDCAVGKVTTANAAMNIASSMCVPIPVVYKNFVGGAAFNIICKYPGVTLAGSIIMSNIINPEPVTNTAKGLWGTLKNIVSAVSESAAGIVEGVEGISTLDTVLASHDADIKNFYYSEDTIEEINLLGDEEGYVGIAGAAVAAPAA